MKILTSPDDNFLYDKIIKLLQEIKLVQGGTDLAYTLRRHRKIKDYCKEKQTSRLNYLESTYFTDDGLNDDAIHIKMGDYSQNYSLQN